MTERPLEELLARYEDDAGSRLPAYAREAGRGRARRKRPRSTREIDAARARLDGATASRRSSAPRCASRCWSCSIGPTCRAGVAIDEAVALARRYASPEAATFVNGVLGAIARARGVGR